MSDKDTFDIRNFAATMREILYYRVRQLNRPDDPQSFWQAQEEITALRKKLEEAYQLAVQKAKRKNHVAKKQRSTERVFAPEIWMYGASAYIEIVLGDLSVKDMSKMKVTKINQVLDGLLDKILKLDDVIGDYEDINELPEEAFIFKKLMSGDKDS